MTAARNRRLLKDRDLREIDFVSQEVADRLRALEIHTLLQLFERIKEADDLRDYLELDREDYDRLCRRTRELVRAKYAAQLPELYPKVSKKGVAIDRLHDPKRPRYSGDS